MESINSITKVYPDAEALSTINSQLNCSECSSTFHSESNLNLHLTKTHKREDLMFQADNGDKIYHCPVSTCIYNNSSFFKSYKYLKQHFLKVHAEKRFLCKLCNMGFATEAFRKRHLDYCNVIFKCCDCDVNYSTYETLKTHSRRKKHRILEKFAYKSSTSGRDLLSQKSDLSLLAHKNCYILPKPSRSNVEISTRSEQSCQTEKGKKSNQETQTLSMKLPSLTVETQTVGYFVKKPETKMNNHKCANTQTTLKDPKNASCNTSFNEEETRLVVHEVERNNSSTQTNIINDNSIHTDTSDLLTDTLDTNFFNCNMETQTDFMFNDELLKYCDYYTNMYTQTCESLLLGEIGLNNTQTQTVFDDVLNSVESQTVMSQWGKLPLSCKDMTHIETQTDVEFKQMLEEINA